MSKTAIKNKKAMHKSKRRFECAFQSFAYGRVREYRGDKLSPQQQKVYELTKNGDPIEEVSELTDMTVVNVISCIATIKNKGWLIN